MKCKKCSANIPPNSRFCLSCGTAVSTSTLTTPTGTTPSSFGAVVAQQNAKQNRWLVIIALLLVAGGAGAMLIKFTNDRALSAAGKTGSNGLVLAPGQGAMSGLVQAPGEGNKNGMVQAPGESKPNKVTQAPNDYAKDVDDYLQFLKRIELSKQRLIREQVGDALAMLPMAQMMRGTIEEGQLNQTMETFDKKYSRISGDWNSLTGEFQKRTPPESCRDLHGKYYMHLSKMQQFVLETQESLNTALKTITESMQGGNTNSVPQDQISKLSDLKGRAGPEMDDSIRKADDALADVCERFHLRKEFDIKGDSGSNGLLLH